jgi:hypothetical protein
VIVVVPVRDNFPGSALAAEVALGADPGVSLEVDQPYPRVVFRNQIPNVRAVRQYEQLDRDAGLLLLETRNRLRKPRPPVFCQTQACDERVAAGSPRKLRA